MFEKYLKYKRKYLDLKYKKGGTNTVPLYNTVLLYFLAYYARKLYVAEEERRENSKTLSGRVKEKMKSMGNFVTNTTPFEGKDFEEAVFDLLCKIMKTKTNTLSFEKGWLINYGNNNEYTRQFFGTDIDENTLNTFGCIFEGFEKLRVTMVFMDDLDEHTIAPGRVRYGAGQQVVISNYIRDIRDCESYNFVKVNLLDLKDQFDKQKLLDDYFTKGLGNKPLYTYSIESFNKIYKILGHIKSDTAIRLSLGQDFREANSLKFIKKNMDRVENITFNEILTALNCSSG